MRDDGDRNPRPTAADAGSGALARARRLAGRPLPLLGEMAFLALVIAIWELARMPLEGPLPLALAHARDWLSVEHTLHLDVEASLIRAAHRTDTLGILRWSYWNFHLPVLFGFMALARLLRPDRYPFLRSAFALSHIPALIVIGLYPLAPPRWVPGMPFAVPAPDGLNGAMHNATAAAASQHVGYPLFIAAATIWLARGSRLSWLTLAYPALVYVIVVGTANHYTLDAIIGGLCIVFGFAVARLVPGPAPVAVREPATPLGVALLAATGYALIVRAVDTASELSLPPNAVTAMDVVLVSGIAAVVAAWWWSRAEQRGAPRLEGSGA